MAKDKCCSCGKLCGVGLFLLGVVVGGILVGVLAKYGQLDFLQGRILGTKQVQETTSGVMFELDEEVEGAWVQATAGEAEIEGAWVQMAEGAWTQLTAETVMLTSAGAKVTLPEGAWTQLADKAWVQFSADNAEGAWTQLREGAWTQLSEDTLVKDANGAWTQLTAGTELQLQNNAWVQLREQGVEGAWTQ